MEILIALGVGVFCVLLDKLADQVINRFKRKLDGETSAGTATNSGEVVSARIRVSVDSLIVPCEKCRNAGVTVTPGPGPCPPTGSKS